MTNTMILFETAMQAIENARNEINGEYLNELFEILAELETMAKETENDFEAFKIRAAINTGLHTISSIQKRNARMRKAA